MPVKNISEENRFSQCLGPKLISLLRFTVTGSYLNCTHGDQGESVQREASVGIQTQKQSPWHQRHPEFLSEGQSILSLVSLKTIKNREYLGLGLLKKEVSAHPRLAAEWGGEERCSHSLPLELSGNRSDADQCQDLAPAMSLRVRYCPSLAFSFLLNEYWNYSPLLSAGWN